MSISKARLATASPVTATAKKTRRPSARDTAGQSAREALKRSPAPPFDVVESKIHVPSLRSGTVSRTALVNRLRATAEPIVILTAPAGYGKTTVLAQWAVRDSRPFAWISVDERDNDPIVLLRHVALALHGIEPLASQASSRPSQLRALPSGRPRFRGSGRPSPNSTNPSCSSSTIRTCSARAKDSTQC